MNTKSTFAILGAALSPLLLAAPGQADNIGSGNPTSIFASKTTTASSTHAGGFISSLAVDGTTKDFVFDDGQASQGLSISGFSSAITSLRFFDDGQFAARTAPSVTIYSSAVNQTSLLAADYTLVGTFALPVNASDHYMTLTNPADVSSNGTGTNSYDTLTGLNIAAGTKSVLFQFGADPNGSGGATFGNAFSEIQAFNNPVPEAPSSVGLGVMLALGGLAVVVRKRSFKA